MRIVLDTAILVRGNGSSQGLARDLLINIVESDHILLLSNQMLYELAKVLRYPRMLALHGLTLASFAALFDMAEARLRAPSFDKFWREVEKLLG